MKSGVPNWAVTAIAQEWQSSMVPDFTNLDKGIAEIEAANWEKHYKGGTSPGWDTLTPRDRMGYSAS